MFGGVLRYYREKAGLTRPELAARIHKSVSLIQAIELGERVATDDVATDLDGVQELRTNGLLSALREQFRSSMNYQAYPEWFAHWPDHEARAVTLRWYEPLVVPGLLQTQAYAHAVLRTRVGASDGEVDDMVAGRMARQAVLHQEGPPTMWVVLDEGVLRRPVGGAPVMAEQLGYLIDAAKRSNVVIQVIPADVGAHEGLRGPFVIADFADGPAVAWQDAAVFGQLVEDTNEIASLMMMWDTLKSEALPRAGSLGLMEEVAKTWI